MYRFEVSCNVCPLFFFANSSNSSYRPRPDFNGEGKPGNQFWNQRHPVPQYNNFLVDNNAGMYNPGFVKRVYPPKKDFGGPSRGMMPKRNSPELDNMSKEDRAKLQSMKAKYPGQDLIRPNWDPSKLETFKKNFNKIHENNKNRSPEEVDAWRASMAITTNGKDVPYPLQEFSEANFPPTVLGEMTKQGFTQPTPIQAQGWSIALSGRDLVGIAQTGSGKFLNLILSMLDSVINYNFNF